MVIAVVVPESHGLSVVTKRRGGREIERWRVRLALETIYSVVFQQEIVSMRSEHWPTADVLPDHWSARL